MNHRRLPGTDLEVSEVCLGTMTWGQQNSEAEAHAQLDYAIAQGVNFIDTAEMYPVPPNAKHAGPHRDFLGSWLRGSGARRPRDRDARSPGRDGATGSAAGAPTSRARTSREAVETSLARLGLD